ncbi:uncharacterized protein SCHCODRAFT_02479622, partial [Schizophyllum commune H4-8]|uniref:uncharacterized protein n=1 Tax=Schizophyllum commune (strain H4-8 / FGSC 9210) TaxID=578458 RepID=UPI00215F852F
SYRVIKWAWPEATEQITSLVRLCVRLGHHPRGWRRAVAVALRKPRKPDYSKPRAYRLITLLECMG